MYKAKAKVQVKDNQGKVVASQDYDKVWFEGTQEDAKGKPMGGDPEGLLSDALKYFEDRASKGENAVLTLLSHITYSYDLGRRATIRQQLVAAASGPEKAIEKQVKDFMAARAAMGKPVTEELARQRVLASLAD